MGHPSYSDRAHKLNGPPGRLRRAPGIASAGGFSPSAGG